MTGHPNGAIYGLASTPQRLLDPVGATTPVRGLVLAGCDVCTPGIQGALMGGVFAAAALMGARGMPAILRAAVRRGRPGPLGQGAAAPRRHARRMEAQP
jgi:hypothetical protein